MHGLKPISNLTGHQISRYSLHAGKALPNVFHLSLSKVKVGEIYAVEPFVTVSNAAGKVRSAKEAYIFRFIKHKSLKVEHAKQLLNYIEKNFRTLPFTERWLKGCIPRYYSTAFSELLSSKSLMAYRVFIEASGKPVAQAEHTVVITKDGCHVLT
jgi:methionyl aminopeptidase